MKPNYAMKPQQGEASRHGLDRRAPHDRLDFCQHILVAPFTYDLAEGKTNGEVIKNSFQETYQLQMVNLKMSLFKLLNSSL